MAVEMPTSKRFGFFLFIEIWRKKWTNETFQNGQLFRFNRQMSCEMRNNSIDPFVLDKKKKQRRFKFFLRQTH